MFGIISAPDTALATLCPHDDAQANATLRTVVAEIGCPVQHSRRDERRLVLVARGARFRSWDVGVDQRRNARPSFPNARSSIVLALERSSSNSFPIRFLGGLLRWWRRRRRRRRFFFFWSSATAKATATTTEESYFGMPRCLQPANSTSSGRPRDPSPETRRRKSVFGWYSRGRPIGRPRRRNLFVHTT